MKILITGSAGFIGMHLSLFLAEQGHQIIGLDNINSYYDTSLKYDRLKEQGIAKENILYNKLVDGKSNLQFIELDLLDAGNLMTLFATQNFEVVIHLAAQAGVRYSITNPRDYIESNITGFFNIIESCRTFPVSHFIFASSSSVYGNSTQVPFKTTQNTDQPVSLYAATKKTNELLAYNYSHLFGIPSTGLRFFTVYGPWGRPDMAYFSFTKNIVEDKPIQLFNNGILQRDFTYIGDIVQSISLLIDKVPKSSPPFSIYNIGNQAPVEVLEFVSLIESKIGKKATILNKPMQDGDVEITYADTSDLETITGFTPNTSLSEGLDKFITWYKNYYFLG